MESGEASTDFGDGHDEVGVVGVAGERGWSLL